MTLVVSDASPLIALHQIDEFELLRGLFGEAVIPPAVAREVTPGVPLPPWVQTRTLRQPMAREILRASLGPGESEAIGLAQEINAEWLLVDDRAARRLAEGLGLAVAGTLGLLVRGKEKGLLDKLGRASRHSSAPASGPRRPWWSAFSATPVRAHSEALTLEEPSGSRRPA